MAQTLTQIAAAIEKAVADSESAKAKLDGFRSQVAQAEADYQSAINSVKTLHGEYQAYIQHVLTAGGTLHR